MSTFRLSRSFAAPRDLVFRAWTEPTRFAAWFAPKGFTTEVATFELRPGGRLHYAQSSEGGQKMWGLFVFEEITPPERLVFVSSFSDEQGGLARHPMAPGWPLQTRSVITFTEAGGRTTLAMEGTPVGATPEELAMFTGAFSGMEGGWKGTLDALEAHLTQA